MLLVIVGAGASYDSVPQLAPPSSSTGGQNNWTPIVQREPGAHEEFRPPLARQLFEDRKSFVTEMQAFPECLPVIPLLRCNVPVEQQLAAFEEQAETFPPRRRQLLAIRFYLQSLIWNCQKSWHHHHNGINNYVTFLDAIERWRHATNERVCIATFNYDTMLEQAMEQVLGMSFEHFNCYVHDPRYHLIKLHGSIDWGLEVEIPSSPRSSKDVIGNADILRVSTRFKKASLNVVFEDNSVGFPAIAIPVEKKSQFMCPAEHFQIIGNLLTSVNKVITLGWRAQEQHFLKMLHSPLTGLSKDCDLMIVSGSVADAAETSINLGFAGPSPAKRSQVGNGFTSLINQLGLLESFLR